MHNASGRRAEAEGEEGEVMFPPAAKLYKLSLEDETRECRKIRGWLEAAQHFEVTEDIWRFACELSTGDRRNPETDPPIPAPDGGRLPATVVVITFWGDSGGIIALNDRDAVSIYTFNAEARQVERLGDYTPGSSDLYIYPEGAGQKEADITMGFAYLFAVLNQTRFVKREPASTRQQRRRMIRDLGFAPSAWHRVTWQIGKDVRAKVAEGDPDNARPLHFCRAHWRRASEGQPKAQLRNDAPGWWCWVSECWKGHPAFGIRLHHYTPKLGPEAVRRLGTDRAAASAIEAHQRQTDENV